MQTKLTELPELTVHEHPQRQRHAPVKLDLQTSVYKYGKLIYGTEWTMSIEHMVKYDNVQKCSNNNLVKIIQVNAFLEHYKLGH